MGGSRACVKFQRVTNAYLVDPDRVYSIVPMDIQQSDVAGRTYHCGNCGEYASVAFMYCVRQSGIHSLMYVDANPSVDHCFVVIGRNLESDVEKPTAWGDDCWICDAWDNKVFRTSVFLGSMYKGSKMQIGQSNVRTWITFPPSVIL
jgi:hypothetical protein